MDATNKIFGYLKMNEVSIRLMQDEDSSTVLSIFAEGIATGIATFETKCPTWNEFNQRFLKSPRLVAENKGQIIGWVVLSPVSSRSCYQGVAEISLYVASHERGRGVGRLLLQALIDASEKEGFWTLQGTINELNQASIELHKKCGFRMVGYRERIAKRDGKWQNTVILERRSNKFN